MRQATQAKANGENERGSRTANAASVAWQYHGRTSFGITIHDSPISVNSKLDFVIHAAIIEPWGVIE